MNVVVVVVAAAVVVHLTVIALLAIHVAAVETVTSTSRPSFFSQPSLIGKCNNNSLYFTSVKKTLFH